MTTPDPAASLRVSIVAPTLDILGGQAVQADRLIQAFRDVPGIEVRLVPINPQLPRPLRWLQRIKYVRTLVTSVAYVLLLLRTIPSSHLVHIFSASYLSFVIAPTPALLVSKLFRKPTLLNYHSGEAEDHLTRWGSTAIPTLRLADRIVVQSRYLIDVFASFGLHAEAIANSVEIDRFSFRPRAKLSPIFLSNRNFEAHYGVRVVLRAFSLISREVPDAQLLVAGRGSQEGPLRALRAKLACDNIQFLGQVSPSDMVGLYDKADVFLNASEVDNMPLSILEAQASGVPVVTTDAGGIPYLVESGRTGLMVAMRDPDALAAAALELLGDEALAERLSVEGRKSVEANYTMEGVLPAWIKIYRELALEGDRAPALPGPGN